MSKEARTCVICGQLGTVRWTISADDVVLADLCVEHAKPLEDITAAVQQSPSNALKGWEKPAKSVPRNRMGRGMAFEPLDWTPPEERPGKRPLKAVTNL